MTRPGKDIARRDDPETSKAAADRIDLSGRRQSQRVRIREWVTGNPGHIRNEIASGVGLTHAQAWRRISDEINGGYLVYGPARDGQQTVWPKALDPAQQGKLL